MIINFFYWRDFLREKSVREFAFYGEFPRIGALIFHLLYFMKELRIFLITICIINIAAVNMIASAATNIPVSAKKQTISVKKPTKIVKNKKKTPPIAPVITAVTKSSTVSYMTPAGNVPVLFTVTVKSGVITAVSSVTKAQDSTSIGYQNSFASKISQAVVGKKITGLNLSAIGGASLTTAAFGQFVNQSF